MAREAMRRTKLEEEKIPNGGWKARSREGGREDEEEEERKDQGT